ncbi:hypothetical protein CMI37_08785 [Candidatus Pacearchaeota archaeon]|nr:hypothetical protein [Candidatus Pacearchaeota archaeon]
METFFIRSSGQTSQIAFENAKKKAQLLYGYAGYSNAILKKNDFVLHHHAKSSFTEAISLSKDLLLNTENNRPRLAGCLYLSTTSSTENEYLFFGRSSC